MQGRRSRIGLVVAALLGFAQNGWTQEAVGPMILNATGSVKQYVPGVATLDGARTDRASRPSAPLLPGADAVPLLSITRGPVTANGASELATRNASPRRGAWFASARTGAGVLAPEAIIEDASSPYRTAIGAGALSNNTGTGLGNTAAGHYTLYSNTTGGLNTGIGAWSMYSSTTGNYNTAAGYTSLWSNTSGSYNTALGNMSLYQNTVGQANTAIGSEALISATNASSNTAVGISALRSTSASSNTAIGAFAGYYATAGAYNVFLGAQVRGTSADANTIRIGVPYDGSIGQNQTFIAGIHGTAISNGLPVVIDANGQLGTGDTSGNFLITVAGNAGIGTTAPVAKLDVQQSADAATGGLRVMNASENRAVYLWVDGADVARLDSGVTGAGDLAINSPDGGNVGIGTVPGAKLDIQQSADVATGGMRVMNAGQNRAIYLWADSSDVARLDSGFTGAGPLVINSTSGGNVGIGTAVPTHPLEMRSGAYVSAGGVWTNASSRSLKQQIAPLTLDAALAAVAQLAPVTYEFKASPGEHHVGFIAEDVPQLVASKDRKSLSPMDIVAVVTKVVQDQQATIANQEATIANHRAMITALQQMNADLQARLARLEALVPAVTSRGTR